MTYKEIDVPLRFSCKINGSVAHYYLLPLEIIYSSCANAY